MLKKLDGYVLPTFDLTAHQLQTERGWSAPGVIFAALVIDNLANVMLAVVAFFSDVWIWAVAMALLVALAGQQVSEFKELRKDMTAQWSEDLTRKYAFMAEHWRTKFSAMRGVTIVMVLSFIVLLGHPAADGEHLLVSALGAFTLGKFVRGYGRCVLPQPPSIADRAHRPAPGSA